MDTIFVNSKYGKTSDLHRLLLNLSDKIGLRRRDKYYAFIKSKDLLYMEKYKKVM